MCSNRYELPKFEKNFYKEHPAITNLTEAQVQEIRSKLQIRVATEAPRPITSFEHGSFPKYVLDQVEKEGFKVPCC